MLIYAAFYGSYGPRYLNIEHPMSCWRAGGLLENEVSFLSLSPLARRLRTGYPLHRENRQVIGRFFSMISDLRAVLTPRCNDREREGFPEKMTFPRGKEVRLRSPAVRFDSRFTVLLPKCSPQQQSIEDSSLSSPFQNARSDRYSARHDTFQPAPELPNLLP